MKRKLALLLSVCMMYAATTSATVIIMSGTLQSSTCKNGDSSSSFTVKCHPGQGICQTMTINDGIDRIIYCTPLAASAIPMGVPVYNDYFSGSFLNYDRSFDAMGAEVHTIHFIPAVASPAN